MFSPYIIIGHAGASEASASHEVYVSRAKGVAAWSKKLHRKLAESYTALRVTEAVGYIKEIEMFLAMD